MAAIMISAVLGSPGAGCVVLVMAPEVLAHFVDAAESGPSPSSECGASFDKLRTGIQM